ncbi:MAG: hypothetical protein AVDCRST_MAG17-1144, partial [uncultured Solirubrobacterales bacterium]
VVRAGCGLRLRECVEGGARGAGVAGGVVVDVPDAAGDRDVHAAGVGLLGRPGVLNRV